MNGNREQTNNFLLDGVDVNDSIDNRIGYQPNVDALEEVKVLTGNAGGEFGNVGGASVVMTLKSGTNEFHGNVFEFLRNEKLDANGFFRNRSQATAVRAALPAQHLRRHFRRSDHAATKRSSSWTTKAPNSAVPARLPRASLPRPGATAISRSSCDRIRSSATPLTGQSVPGQHHPSQSGSSIRLRLHCSARPSLYPLPNQPGTGALGVTNNFGGSHRAAS